MPRPDTTLVRAEAQGPHTVDVWRIPLNESYPPLEYLPGLLSSDEADRAGRYVFSKDRNRFIRVRGLLRSILGRNLDIHPASVKFRYAPAGKPHLVDIQNSSGLRFNVSHSADLALVAVGFGRELGIDVERIRPEVDLREIARRFFSPREVLELFSLPDEMQCRGFFNCWTRKEAFVKALGEGLSFPLDSFDVSLGGAALLRSTDPRQWILRDVSPAADYAAALAVEGESDVQVVWRSARETSQAGMFAKDDL